MTAQETCLIHDDNCIHYSVRQDIRCLQCLKNEPYKDSIIIAKDSLIVLQQTFIAKSDILVELMNNQSNQLRTQVVKLKKKRRNAFILGGCTTIGAFLLTFFLTF